MTTLCDRIRKAVFNQQACLPAYHHSHLRCKQGKWHWQPIMFTFVRSAGLWLDESSINLPYQPSINSSNYGTADRPCFMSTGHPISLLNQHHYSSMDQLITRCQLNSLKFDLLNARWVGNIYVNIEAAANEGSYNVYLLTETCHTLGEDVVLRHCCSSSFTFCTHRIQKRRSTTEVRQR